MGGHIQCHPCSCHTESKEVFSANKGMLFFYISGTDQETQYKASKNIYLPYSRGSCSQ